LRDAGWGIVGTDVAQDDDLKEYSDVAGCEDNATEASAEPPLQDLRQVEITKPSVVLFGKSRITESFKTTLACRYRFNGWPLGLW